MRELLDGTGTFVVHNFMDAAECVLWRDRAEVTGFGEAPINTFRGAVRRPDIRNNDRAMIDRPDWAAELWSRIQPHFQDVQTLVPAVGLNERLRFYRYDSGQRFAPHLDGSFRRPNSRVRSLYTALVYLNDDFEGGQTRFYEHDTLVRPTQGMALFFVHNQLHEGCEVVSGRKYVLRTDVMFDLSSTD